TIAIFDFDGTLTTKDTFIEFAKYSVGWGCLIKGIIKSLPWLLAWKLHLIAGGKAKEQLFSQLYKGMSLTTFEEYCLNFADRISKIERRNLVEYLHSHLKKKDQVFIVSASFPEWIIPWAKRHGISENCIIGTGIETDNYDILTGKFSTPNCNEAEKVKRVREYIPYLSDCEIYAYGDSSGDRAILNVADHPFWV
ncbi:MAG: HAD-IB family hydrolase, partial [Duncaniella sp.]|nr:HAD-IB family hydrolase [Duncaniella sp.]